MEGPVISENHRADYRKIPQITVQLLNLCQIKSTITAFSHRLQCGYFVNCDVFSFFYVFMMSQYMLLDYVVWQRVFPLSSALGQNFSCWQYYDRYVVCEFVDPLVPW